MRKTATRLLRPLAALSALALTVFAQPAMASASSGGGCLCPCRRGCSCGEGDGESVCGSVDRRIDWLAWKPDKFARKFG